MSKYPLAGPVLVLGAILAVHANLFAQAQTHVVTPAEMQSAAVAASRSHQHNVAAVTQFLSLPQAEKALRSAHVDPRQVKTAVSSLSDEELAQLASRADKAQADFAAGALSNHDLLLIILGLVALIVIVIAVR